MVSMLQAQIILFKINDLLAHSLNSFKNIISVQLILNHRFLTPLKLSLIWFFLATRTIWKILRGNLVTTRIWYDQPIYRIRSLPPLFVSKTERGLLQVIWTLWLLKLPRTPSSSIKSCHLKPTDSLVFFFWVGCLTFPPRCSQPILLPCQGG